MQLKIKGIPTDLVTNIRDGGGDANGQKAQQQTAVGLSNPCRHCLGLIEEGDELLILSYRPFDNLQPYAETGPIFLHKASCPRYESAELPEWFAFLDPAIIRGYSDNNWIRYDTGEVVPGCELTAKCESILEDPTVAYVHIRSKFNCFQCLVERV